MYLTKGRLAKCLTVGFLQFSSYDTSFSTALFTAAVVACEQSNESRLQLWFSNGFGFARRRIDGAGDAAFLAAAAVPAVAVVAPGLNAVRTMERTTANDQTSPLISMVSVKARKGIRAW